MDIQTLKLVSGTLPRTAMRLTLEWATLHRQELVGELDAMRNEADPQEDCPAGVGARVPWRVAEVRALSGHRLAVRFVDGTQGEVDASRLVFGSQPGVFERLRDPALFAQVRIEHGAVTWPGDLDLAPDAMHEAIKANGRWTPE